MSVADATVITSTRESGPLVARESLACGTPVVSVNVGDVAEYLPEFCVVENYDAIELADAVELALQNDWSEGFSVIENYSSDYVKTQWQSVLSSLAE